MRQNNNSNMLKPESVQASIANCLENGMIDSALDIINYWESFFPLEGEGRSVLLFWKARVCICQLEKYENSKDLNKRIQLLKNAIEVGNALFESNEDDNYPLEEEVEKVWFKLVDHQAMIYADFMGEQPEEESGDDTDFDDEEKSTLDIISEAFHKCIGVLLRPNFKH